MAGRHREAYTSFAVEQLRHERVDFLRNSSFGKSGADEAFRHARLIELAPEVPGHFPGIDRIKECPYPQCGRLFLDQSKNRSRRWCEMSMCGNRTKARRHYRRGKEIGG